MASSLCAIPGAALAARTSPSSARRTSARRTANTLRVNAAAATAAITPTVDTPTGLALTTTTGEAKLIPFWREDQTVVVAFLRHFG